MTDPDSRPLPIAFGFVQGYNAQAAVNEQQIVLAAEITNNSTDFSQLRPNGHRDPGRAGASRRRPSCPDAVAADAGYWNEEHIDEVVANKHIPVLVAPDKVQPRQPRGQTWTGGRYDWMRTGAGSELRPADLPKTQTDHRADVRQHQTQRRCQPLSPTRPGQGAHRVAITDDDREPHQGLPPPDRRRRGLKGGPTPSHRRSRRTR